MPEWILRLGDHDSRVLDLLVSRRHPRLDRVMGAITHLGGGSFTIAVVLLLLWNHEGAMRSAGARGGFALALSHLLVQLLKHRVARPRPRLAAGLASLVRAPDRFSFPSGHAAASLSIGLMGAALLPFAAALTVLAASLVVGLSRCYLGVHYPADVLAGWALAGFATWLSTPGLTLLGGPIAGFVSAILS